MMRWKLALAAAAGLAVAALAAPAANAAPGYTTTSLSLRAGPGRDYPAVLRLRPGTPVEIFGCQRGWDWCDIGVGPDRGWVSGRFLQADFQSRRRGLVEVAPQIGVPLITFDFGHYWGDHYHGRPWFTDHDRWGHR
ncbi:SH3 domain-containing protein [Inquilinus sp. 2KB_12]|uniref:SH3 domain-containing protein n=1 Tax=Inquilinus sp. 2KB_12 TaxID=3232975 RepID=UPI003F93B0C9